MGSSGQIVLDGDVIRYRSPTYRQWDLPVANLRLMGEATNQWGPCADDYFFCFATGPGMWLEASFYAEGRDEFLQALGAPLGCTLQAGLCHSTDFASRVVWPPSLAGEAMFKYEEVPPKDPLRKLFGSMRKQQTYAERVAATLAGETSPHVTRDQSSEAR
jgi:hypothetical protein